MPNGGKGQRWEKRKQRQNILVAVILILLILLAAVIGLYFRSGGTLKAMPGGGSGWSSGPLSKPPQSEGEGAVAGQQSDEESSSLPRREEDALSEDIPTDGGAQTEAEIPADGIQERNWDRDDFLRRAAEVEDYARAHLETSTNQRQRVEESEILYEKWDELLNEIYGYLREQLSEQEFSVLREEELAWIREKEAAIEAAGENCDNSAERSIQENLEAIYYTQNRVYTLIRKI